MLNIQSPIKRWKHPFYNGGDRTGGPLVPAREKSHLRWLWSQSFAQDGQRFSLVYPAAVLGSIVGVLLLFWVGLKGLDHFGLLPPPQLANNFCLDEKLRYLRSHPFDQPAVLAVGSSVAWRSFDGDAVKRAGGGQVMNAAFCGLTMNQTAFTTEYFLARYPSVRDVLAIVAPQDLTECSINETRVFDPVDVDDYVYRHGWEYKLYLEYFDPFTLIKNVLILRTMRNGGLPVDTIVFDRYGAAPLDTTITLPNLVYPALPAFDPTCFAALRQLAEKLTASGRRLVVVTMPINPEWTKRYDLDGTVMRHFADKIREATAGTSTIFWDADHAAPMPRAAFVDAIHIRWSAVKLLSREIVAATGVGRRVTAQD